MLAQYLGIQHGSCWSLGAYQGAVPGCGAAAQIHGHAMHLSRPLICLAYTVSAAVMRVMLHEGRRQRTVSEFYSYSRRVCVGGIPRGQVPPLRGCHH